MESVLEPSPKARYHCLPADCSIGVALPAWSPGNISVFTTGLEFLELRQCPSIRHKSEFTSRRFLSVLKAKSPCCFEASSEAYLPNRRAVVLPGDIKCAEVALHAGVARRLNGYERVQIQNDSDISYDDSKSDSILCKKAPHAHDTHPLKSLVLFAWLQVYQ